MVRSTAAGKEVSRLQQQPMISTYFSQKSSPAKQRKRSYSPTGIGDSGDDSDAPPKKRTRSNGHLQSTIDSSPGIGEAGPSRKQYAGQAEQWRFAPSSPENSRAEKIYTTAEKEARKKNHEAFKRKLLKENSMFIRKKCSREDSEAPINVNRDSEHDTDDSGSDSDPAFTVLHKQFSNKPKDRGKSKVPLPRKQKVEDVGPSGQTWTPLEQQVSSYYRIFLLLCILMSCLGSQTQER